MAFTDPFNLLIVLGIVAVLVIWGPSKIPQLARSLGQAKKEFQRGSEDGAHQPNPAVSRDLRDGRVPYVVGLRGIEMVADDDLLKVAQTLGISTEGKDRKQISDEVTARVRSQV